MSSCDHHHRHASLPIGFVIGALVVCATCGVHLCGDEIAVMMEVLRLLPQALLHARLLAALGRAGHLLQRDGGHSDLEPLEVARELGLVDPERL